MCVWLRYGRACAVYRRSMLRRLVPQLVVVVGGLLVVAASCAPEPARQPVILPTVGPPSTTAAATTSAAPVLPANCALMIPGNQLDAAVGVPVSAKLNLVIGEALPAIGRTGRTTCGYGIPVGSTYPVEISLSSYTTVQQAKARVTVTITDAEQQGVGSTSVPAGGVDGSYIPFPSGGLVVASSGIYSVAVSMAKMTIPADQVATRAGAVAGIVLAGAGV